MDGIVLRQVTLSILVIVEHVHLACGVFLASVCSRPVWQRTLLHLGCIGLHLSWTLHGHLP